MTNPDFPPLPRMLSNLTPPARLAWDIVREMHHQGRISRYEGMAFLNALADARAEPSIPEAVTASQLQPGE